MGPDEFGLALAELASKRAQCSRRSVGAAIFNMHGDIASIGWNSQVGPRVSCLEGGCPRGQKTYEDVSARSDYSTADGLCHAVHAEARAMLQASKADLDRSTIYITTSPCHYCMVLIEGSGIIRAVWPGGEWTRLEWVMASMFGESPGRPRPGDAAVPLVGRTLPPWATALGDYAWRAVLWTFTVRTPRIDLKSTPGGTSR